MAAGAVRGEDLRAPASRLGSSSDTETPSLPQAATRQARAAAIRAMVAAEGAHAGGIILFAARDGRPRMTSAEARERLPSRAELRSAMSRFPTGVTVITALTDDGPAGLSANAVTSLSLDPPLMLACVDRGSRTLRALEQAGRFGVNVLAGDAAELAVGFASKAPTVEKWTDVGWSESERGSRCSTPRSSGSAASSAT